MVSVASPSLKKGRSQLVREAKARRALIARLARDNVNVFCEYVLKDEKTGKPTQQAAMHEAWHNELDQHKRVVLWSAIESGKSMQISVARTLYELGKDPSLRFLLLSNTKNQARKIASLIKTYIESSTELHDVFPHLQPGEKWGEYEFNIKGHMNAKDPSVQTSGLFGNILGSRIDRLVADDVLDLENTMTQDQRQKLIDWWPIPAGRVDDAGSIRVVGTAFHPHDLLHWLARQPVYTALRYPVIDPITGYPRWPERWSLERIAQKKAELHPLEAARQLFCDARDDASSRFKREWIDIALRMGDGTEMCDALTTIPRGYRVYTGVDLAVQQHSGADLTVLFTIAVDPFGVRSVLNIESGRWSGPEIVARIRSKHQRFQSHVIVENNAAQDFIRQFVIAQRGPTIPIVGYTTGRTKAHPEFGIEGIATEMMNGKWRIPNRGGQMHPEVSAWVNDMLFYDPRTHTGDRLMASFFAREGVRLGDMRPRTVSHDFNRT